MPIKIDPDKCQGIGDCIDACPVGVIEKIGDKCVATHNDECLECEACLSSCPNSAIEMA
ncbi:MAG: ferredoxin family protein [Chloroflexi bacterium]|nr:ferredoxin family protein [Chloroflexota bacterium]